MFLSFTYTNKQTGQLWYPLAIDVDNEDNIYVASYTSSMPVDIQVFYSNGTWMKDIHIDSDLPQGIKGLALDRSTGDIYLGYTWLSRVVKISANGTVLNTWTSGAQDIIGIS